MEKYPDPDAICSEATTLMAVLATMSTLVEAEV